MKLSRYPSGRRCAAPRFSPRYSSGWNLRLGEAFADSAQHGEGRPVIMAERDAIHPALDGNPHALLYELRRGLHPDAEGRVDRKTGPKFASGRRERPPLARHERGIAGLFAVILDAHGIQVRLQYAQLDPPFRRVAHVLAVTEIDARLQRVQAVVDRAVKARRRMEAKILPIGQGRLRGRVRAQGLLGFWRVESPLPRRAPARGAKTASLRGPALVEGDDGRHHIIHAVVRNEIRVQGDRVFPDVGMIRAKRPQPRPDVRDLAVNIAPGAIGELSLGPLLVQIGRA